MVPVADMYVLIHDLLSRDPSMVSAAVVVLGRAALKM